MVTVNALEVALTFPAASVWRTYTVFVPCVSAGALELQAVPSEEYCTVAPDSIPVRLSTPLEVIPSLPLLPVSLDSDTPGVATVVSSVKL